jgi:putative methyltransferase (TIGR04325 family)
MAINCRSEFHGVFAEREQYGRDLFVSDLWLEFCRDRALSMGLRRGGNPFAIPLLRRLKHMLLPRRWPSVMKSFREGKIPDFETPNYLAPLIDSFRSTIRTNGSCSVLDVGGGWGDNFLLVGRALGAEADRVSFSIVDNERITRLGADLFASCRGLSPTFVNDMPGSGNHFDYVVVCGTLPYVGDWRAFLRLCKQAGQSIYVARTAITRGEGFYTQQTVFVDDVDAGTYPYRVFGYDELMAAMGDYQLVFQAKTEDYSRRFEGLPGKIEASYLAQMWSRKAMALH